MLRSLEEKFPQTICMGCSAHGLALLIKDFHNVAHCKWSSKVYDAACMMSNTINGGERVKAALHKEQQEHYEQIRACCVHCPTRFATLHFVTKDLLRSRQAIRTMCLDEGWNEVAKHATHKDAFFSAATGAHPILCRAYWCFGVLAST